MWDVFQNSGSKQICPFPPVMDNLSWGLNECGLTWHQLKLLFEWAVVEYKVWFPQKGSNILDSLVTWNHQELGADLEATPRQWCPGYFCGPGCEPFFYITTTDIFGETSQARGFSAAQWFIPSTSTPRVPISQDRLSFPGPGQGLPCKQSHSCQQSLDFLP